MKKIAATALAAMLVDVASAGADQGWRSTGEDGGGPPTSLLGLAAAAIGVVVLLVGLLSLVEFAKSRRAKYAWQAAACALMLMLLFDAAKFGWLR